MATHVTVAGMERTSTAQTTEATLLTQEAMPAEVALALQRSQSSFLKSCTRSCGTCQLSPTRAFGPPTVPIRSSTA
jgi:hypothetical protein